MIYVRRIVPGSVLHDRRSVHALASKRDVDINVIFRIVKHSPPTRGISGARVGARR
jgi:hypothetical protein